ncbi:MAG: metallophosphoesterase [Candidatus Omnitrophica bacterium]|nr:metallophosphoesterase [Candidatus Omnitrophota bacterium]
MKKTIKIIAMILIAACAYSLAPVAGLYLSSDPAPYTNSQASEKLKANKGNYFEFIVLSDIHAGLIFDDSAALKVVRSINREGRFKKVPIDFVATAGDNTFRGSAWDYRIYNRIRSQVSCPVISAMGNHDEDKDDGSLFRKYVGKKDLSFTDRNSYFIVIDNISGNMTDGQFADLEEDLKKSSGYAHRFIIMHKPPVAPYFQSWYRPEGNTWSYRFMKLCEEYKVDIVFSGHEHIFKAKEFGGVKYLTSGGGGMPTQIPGAGGAFLHYTVVKVYNDYIDYEVRRIFPPIWEFFGYYMWSDIFYFLKDALS